MSVVCVCVCVCVHVCRGGKGGERGLFTNYIDAYCFRYLDKLQESGKFTERFRYVYVHIALTVQGQILSLDHTQVCRHEAIIIASSVCILISLLVQSSPLEKRSQCFIRCQIYWMKSAKLWPTSTCQTKKNWMTLQTNSRYIANLVYS